MAYIVDLIVNCDVWVHKRCYLQEAVQLDVGAGVDGDREKRFEQVAQELLEVLHQVVDAVDVAAEC